MMKEDAGWIQACLVLFTSSMAWHGMWARRIPVLVTGQDSAYLRLLLQDKIEKTLMKEEFIFVQDYRGFGPGSRSSWWK